jgi:hypothetical protein
MKPRANTFAIPMAALLSMTTAWTLRAASAVPVVSNMTAQSVFVQPASAKEGCDPFYPKSTRPYVVVVKPGETAKLDLSVLVVKGVTKVGNKTLVVINNKTLGVGDSDTVTTLQGKITIRCLEINANTVVIEANGQRQTLPL